MKITVKLNRELYNNMFKTFSNWVNSDPSNVMSRINMLKNISPSYAQFIDDCNSGNMNEYITKFPHEGRKIYRELLPFYNSIKESYE